MTQPQRRYFRLSGMLKMIADSWQEDVWTRWNGDLNIFLAEVGARGILRRGLALVAVRASKAHFPGLIPDITSPGYFTADVSTSEGRDLSIRMASLLEPVPDKLLDFVTPDRRWTIGNHYYESQLFVVRGECFVSVPTGVTYQPLKEMTEIFEQERTELEAILIHYGEI